MSEASLRSQWPTSVAEYRLHWNYVATPAAAWRGAGPAPTVEHSEGELTRHLEDLVALAAALLELVGSEDLQMTHEYWSGELVQRRAAVEGAAAS
jgi:hypothetical protein